ncbi:hypothetical protein BGW41_001292 [Actinomortierella wolfii]|nr:hypothetical protein BGW41_001292 [Actinomortierella wolfii]
MLKELHSIDDLDRTLATHHKVIMFYTTPWAADESKMAEKQLEDLSKQFPDIMFYYINVDAVAGVVDREKVNALPTIQGYYRGSPFGEGVGSDAAKIEDLLRELHFQPEVEA